MHMGQNSLFLVAENLARQTEQTRISRAAKSARLPGLSWLSWEFVFMARSILQRAIRPRKVRESRRRRRQDLRPYGQSPRAPKPYIACASDGPRSLPPPRRSAAAASSYEGGSLLFPTSKKAFSVSNVTIFWAVAYSWRKRFITSPSNAMAHRAAKTFSGVSVSTGSNL